MKQTWKIYMESKWIQYGKLQNMVEHIRQLHHKAQKHDYI